MRKITSISFRRYETDLWEHLQQKEDVSHYIKSLIKKDINKPDLLKQIEFLLDKKLKNISPATSSPIVTTTIPIQKIDEEIPVGDIDVGEIMKIISGL
jgi:23S rRNA A1618 N6-methylase RlmF